MPAIPHFMRRARLTWLPAAICLGGLCLVALLSSCAPPAARRLELLDRGRDQLDAGQLDRAEQTLTELLKQPSIGSDALRAEAFMLRGQLRRQRDQLEQAAEDFANAADTFDSEPHSARAHLALAEIAQVRGDHGQVVHLIGLALPHLGSAPALGDALFMLGVAQQRLGQWEPARLSFSRLLHRVPNSPHAHQARRRARYEAYSLVAGVFVEPRPAERLAANLKARGLAADIWLDDAESQPVLMVRVGHASTLGQAQTLKLDLQRTAEVPLAIVPEESPIPQADRRQTSPVPTGT